MKDVLSRQKRMMFENVAMNKRGWCEAWSVKKRSQCSQGGETCHGY
jgi:hypothetical protein